MKILFTCGGTAGHINPAVALARTFQSHHPDCQVLFVGADGGMEVELVTKEGFPIRTVTISNLRRSMSLAGLRHNLKTAENMVRSRGQARKILDDFQPDLVVGTGGYASYPVVKAAARRHIPTAIHESNAVPGLTTKTLAKVVDLVMVGFQEAVNHYADPKKVKVTGTPVRPEFFRWTRQDARDKLGITDERPLVLSFWGSLGASAMNREMVEFISLCEQDGCPFRLLHGAGRSFDEMQKNLSAAGADLAGKDEIEIRRYIYDMPMVMAASDVVLCRAGASTLSEVAAVAKPAVLVPSPNVTANHQYQNARVLADRGGAVLLEEKDCSGKVLYDAVKGLLDDPGRRDAMSRALEGISSPDATEKIYETLLALMK